MTIICLVAHFLSSKYPDALEMARLSAEYCRGLEKASSNGERLNWEEQIKAAEAVRLDCPAAMDIYGSKAVTELDVGMGPPLTDSESEGSVEQFLRVVLNIEERQYVILPRPMVRSDTDRLDVQDRLRRFRKEPREEERQELEALRVQLVNELGTMQALQGTIVPGGICRRSRFPRDDAAAFDYLDEQLADQEHHEESPELNEESPEYCPLPLPSHGNIGDQVALANAELVLRRISANQHVAALRDAVAQKSLQYSDVIRNAPRKSVRTKSRALIAKINQRISFHCRAYRRCRAAIYRLSDNTDVQSLFPDLLPDHVKGSTALRQPNLPGSSELRLSWIWQVAGASSAEPTSGTTECESCIALSISPI